MKGKLTVLLLAAALLASPAVGRPDSSFERDSLDVELDAAARNLSNAFNSVCGRPDREQRYEAVWDRWYALKDRLERLEGAELPWPIFALKRRPCVQGYFDANLRTGLAHIENAERIIGAREQR